MSVTNDDAATPAAANVASEETAPVPALHRRGRPRRQPGAAGAEPPRPARPPLSVRGVAARASDRARQVAAAVLEVLAGVRSPATAAQALDVVPVRVNAGELSRS
jgi:hypothetical protein